MSRYSLFRMVMLTVALSAVLTACNADAAGLGDRCRVDQDTAESVCLQQ